VLEGVIILLVLFPLSLFIHETGHALGVILANQHAKANVYLGGTNEENKLKFKVGRIHFYLTLAFSGFCFIANREELPPFTTRQRLMLLSGGPIISLVTCLLLFLFAYLSIEYRSLSLWLEKAAFVNFIIFISTCLPYKYPAAFKYIGGFPTDGLQILNLLRERRTVQNG